MWDIYGVCKNLAQVGGHLSWSSYIFGKSRSIMKQSNYSISILWDKRSTKVGTKLCPVKLSLNLNGLQFLVGLKLYATEEDFEKAIKGKGGSNENKELRKQMNDYMAKAETILERMPNPTRESFKRLFKSETDLFTTNKTDVSFLFEEKIQQLMKEERIKTAENCAHALKSLKRFKKELYFEDLDVHFLEGYKAWVAKEGNSPTTAQIYLRNLRAIFNKAIKDGYISEKHYPFKNFSIGTSAKSKSVLYPAQLKQLWEYAPVGLRERRAKDYFFFCYLSNGMNFKDVVYLKFKDMKTETLLFVREKTKRTNKVAEKQIKVHLHPELKRIIQILGNKTENPEEYIFPILNGLKTPFEKEKRRKAFQKMTNKSLRAIGKKLKFEDNLCLNLARHSFATRLKIDGTPLSFISDAMGHANTKTTEHYLKSLPDDKFREISESLLCF
jgi:integrase/recombinase XerD